MEASSYVLYRYCRWRFPFLGLFEMGSDFLALSENLVNHNFPKERGYNTTFSDPYRMREKTRPTIPTGDWVYPAGPLAPQSCAQKPASSGGFKLPKHGGYRGNIMEIFQKLAGDEPPTILCGSRWEKNSIHDKHDDLGVFESGKMQPHAGGGLDTPWKSLVSWGLIPNRNATKSS